jgi:predicted RNase H-like HicB family nuclease
MTRYELTAVIEREGEWYVGLCPEFDVVSQGRSIEEARANLTEAVTAFLESAPPEEIAERLHGEVYVTRLEVKVA